MALMSGCVRLDPATTVEYTSADQAGFVARGNHSG
jgi:hypothetical protein